MVVPFVHTGMQEIMPIGANFPRIGQAVCYLISLVCQNQLPNIFFLHILAINMIWALELYSPLYQLNDTKNILHFGKHFEFNGVDNFYNLFF